MHHPEHLRRSFQNLLAAEPAGTAVADVVELIVDGYLEPSAFDEVVQRHGVHGSAAFRDGLLNVVLHAVRTALQDHSLTRDELESIKAMKTIFRISGGAFYVQRRDEVGVLLGEEVQRLLEDGRVDVAESLYQVELQALFDLSYDQYLELIREKLSGVVDSLIAKSLSEQSRTADAERVLYRRLALLDTAFQLSSDQKNKLEGAGIRLSQ